MNKTITVFIFLLLPVLVIADAGYLGSVTQNPAPVTTLGTYPDISMESEEVVVELHPTYADVTAGFTFQNGGEEQTAIMYLPLEIGTVFVSRIAASFEDLKDELSVQVNNQGMATEGLYQGLYDPELRQEMGLSWEEFSALLQVLNSSEPALGEPLYFRKYVLAEDDPDYDSWGNQPLYPAQMLSASWTVPFAPHESKTVTCIYRYFYTQDYNQSTERFAYPLFTGATWAGNIGEGKIYVIPGEDFNWEDIRWVAGIYMPEVEELSYAQLNVALPGYHQKTYSHALLWSFTDFEPKPMSLGHLAFYPDVGSLGVYFMGDEAEEDYIGSLIYLYVSSFYQPTVYTGIKPSGITLRQEPKETANLVAVKEKIKFLEQVDSIETKGNWMKVSYTDYAGEYDRELSPFIGWVNLNEKNEDGLVLPSLLPWVDSYVAKPGENE